MTAALIIAVRGGPLAKSRCAEVLSARDRQALVAAMLEDMLDAANAADGRLAVTVVTPTPELAVLARRHGANILAESRPCGLNAAFAAGFEAARTRTPAEPILLLPGDLPLIGPADLDMAIDAARDGALVLAPTCMDGGTGAIALPPGARLPFLFGPDSFRRHRAAARIFGHPVHVIESGPLGADIDRPEDLDRIRQAPATRGAAVLRRAGAAHPLKVSA